MTDARILVFNLGRVDFRKKFLASYAMDVQSSMSVYGCTTDRALAVWQDMRTATGVLVAMRGVVVLVRQLLSGLVLVPVRGGTSESAVTWCMTNDP